MFESHRVAPPFCCDCEHAMLATGNDWTWAECALTEVQHPVTGAVRHFYCMTERITGRCGVTGKNFEARIETAHHEARPLTTPRGYGPTRERTESRTMARQKQPTRPLFDVHHEFVPSLDAMLNEALMLMQAVEFATRMEGLPDEVKKILTERVAAFRATLSADESAPA